MPSQLVESWEVLAAQDNIFQPTCTLQGLRQPPCLRPLPQHLHLRPQPLQPLLPEQAAAGPVAPGQLPPGLCLHQGGCASPQACVVLGALLPLALLPTLLLRTGRLRSPGARGPWAPASGWGRSAQGDGAEEQRYILGIRCTTNQPETNQPETGMPAPP